MVKCDICGSDTKHEGRVKRKTKTKYGKVEWIFVERVKCITCGHVQRVLPDTLTKFKQYESDIIEGVREGLITEDTLGFENYPCSLTMKNWRSQ